MTRPIHQIAADIRRAWPQPYFGARPYLDAMRSLDKISDNFGQDSAASVVRYFLSNASQWRGESARALKTELKALLPEHQPKPRRPQSEPRRPHYAHDVY